MSTAPGVGVEDGGEEDGVVLSLPAGWEAAVIDGTVLGAGPGPGGLIGALEVPPDAGPGEVVARWVGRCLAAVPADTVVSVPGRDLLAEVLRLAAPSGSGGSGTVAAVLDTSATADEAAAVAVELGDDDVLVLCALPPAPDLPIDAYARIHRRRGAIVGPAADGAVPPEVVTAVEAGTDEVREGRPVVPARRWLLLRR